MSGDASTARARARLPWIEVGRSYRRKVRRALRRRGALGTARLIAASLVARLVPPVARRTTVVALSAFDLQYGVDTGGSIELDTLDITSPDAVHGVCYQPTPPEIFTEILGKLPLRPADFTFVDCGSGKGLVLMLASQTPFRRIIGVEFSTELHHIAQRNLRIYRSATQRCRDVISVNENATAFDWPAEPLLIYLFNPFRQPVMQSLLQRLEASLAECPRPMWIVYYNPAQHGVFDASARFERVLTDADYFVYRNRA